MAGGISTLSRMNQDSPNHLLYLHGGAYIYEIMGMQWKMLSPLLNEADVAVTVVNSFSRLWVRHISFHSARRFGQPCNRRHFFVEDSSPKPVMQRAIHRSLSTVVEHDWWKEAGRDAFHP
jgi:hypothetical protein